MSVRVRYGYGQLVRVRKHKLGREVEKKWLQKRHWSNGSSSSGSTLQPAQAMGEWEFGNRKVVLRKRPDGLLKENDVELVVDQEFGVDDVVLEDGEVMVRNKYVSMDPTHRIWMSDQPQYMKQLEIGETIRSLTLGEVVASNSDRLQVGDFVYGLGGVQDYYTSQDKFVAKVQSGVPLTANLSCVSGIVGVTAWIGALDIIRPTADETVVVSGASGAVGSVSGQLMKRIAECRVIGICGSDEKCEWLKKEAGFDDAINYKTFGGNIYEELRRVAPEGIDGFFDNTGGPVAEAVFQHANNYARVALCGLISQYNHADEGWGPKNYSMILHRRMTVQGFISGDSGPSFLPWSKSKKILPVLADMVQKKHLVYKEDIREGMENYVPTLNLLFKGENRGKLILQIN